MYKETVTVAIISGKGGVGKTSFALSLAYALHKEQSRTLLVDCDFGLANVDVMLGIKPEKTLQDIFVSDLHPKEAIHTTDEGFDIIPGYSGLSVLDNALYDRDKQSQFIQRLQPSFFSYKYVIMDFGPGIVAPTQIFVDLTNVRIIVVTPDPSSLSNNYALVKIFSQEYEVKKFFVVINKVEQREEEALFETFYNKCRQELDIEFVLLGYISFDKNIFEAIRNQDPFLQNFSKTKVFEDIEILAKKFISSCSTNQI